MILVCFAWIICPALQNLNFVPFFLLFFGFSLLGLLVLCSDAETPAVGFWHGARAPLQISSTEGKRVTPKHLDLMPNGCVGSLPKPGFWGPFSPFWIPSFCVIKLTFLPQVPETALRELSRLYHNTWKNIDLKSLDLILKLGQDYMYMADFALFSITMNDSAVLY